MDATEEKFEKWLQNRRDRIHEITNGQFQYRKYRLKRTGHHCHLGERQKDGTLGTVIIGHDSKVLNDFYKTLYIAGPRWIRLWDIQEIK